MEQKKNFIINVVYYGIVLGIVVAVSMFAMNYLAPFIVGFIIAFILKPIVQKLIKHFGDNKLIRVGVILLFYILVGFTIFWLFIAGISALQNFAKTLPAFYEATLVPTFKSMVDFIEKFFSDMNPVMAQTVDQVISGVAESMKGMVGNISTGVITFITNAIASVPSLLITILIAVISSFFFTLDYQNIVNNIFSLIPDRWQSLVMDVKSGFIGTVGKYLRAYAKLMSLTFVELSIGFFIIGIGNPVGLAFIISIVDILPVLGTGTVMIPWIIFEFVMGNISMGIYLLILYVVITVVRNILEPKVVGDQIGLHPLATLVCIFVGMRLAGIVGLFGLPIMVTIIKTLHDEGKITLFKNLKPNKNVKKDSVEA